MITFLVLELYSPIAKSTPDEIRDVVFATTPSASRRFAPLDARQSAIVKWGVFVRGVLVARHVVPRPRRSLDRA